MGCGWGLSRRALLRTWLVSLLGKTSAGSSHAGIDPVGDILRGFMPAVVFQRRYRLDATILLLGAPLFTRQSVGGGYASVEKSVTSGQERAPAAIAFQFAAGSSPARAHGLNRFGILREAVVGQGDSAEVSFAGLMTRSREESLDEGRKALAAGPGGTECVVARGKTSGPTLQTWIDTLAVTPDCEWTSLGETLCEALRQEPQTAPRETASGPETTFLHAMHNAALCREEASVRRFVHAGKRYKLGTHRRSDRPLELEGEIRDLTGARCAEFRTAYAAGDESGIPTRIEYRPRAFLRLTLEAELGATQPVIPSAFQKEGA